MTLLDAIEAHADRLERVRVHQLLPLRDRPHHAGAFGDRLRHSYFLSAKLRGRTIRQRAEALIGIAHPSFRDQLRGAARKLGYL